MTMQKLKNGVIGAIGLTLVMLLPKFAMASPLTADIAFARATNKADLALRRIDIDSSFQGMQMLLFGARHDAGDIVVAVRGPDLSYMVRKKERVLGIWANREQHEFDGVSGFYSLASSRPLERIGNDYLLSSLGLNVDHASSIFPNASVDKENKEFVRALLDKQTLQQLYHIKISDVKFIGDTLFRTVINFPENIPRGTYTAEVYLFRDGKLTGMEAIPLSVQKRGFDAFLFNLAYQWPAIYGILAALLALFLGWAAGTIFRRI